jgi:hypothetical protein
MQWQRAGVTIDVQNGDCCEEENHRPKVRWSGIVLEAAYQTGLRPLETSYPADALHPPIESDTASEGMKKTTPARESIKEATLALWPDGIPLSLQLNIRDDQIIEWQRENTRTVVSPKTIRRYLTPDGRLL